MLNFQGVVLEKKHIGFAKYAHVQLKSHHKLELEGGLTMIFLFRPHERWSFL